MTDWDAVIFSAENDKPLEYLANLVDVVRK